MFRLLLVISLVLTGALPAYASGLDTTYSTWERLRSPDTLGISFAEGVAFMEEHPGWPEEKIIRLRTEAAALQEQPAKATMAKFCEASAPISGRGMIACAIAGAGSDTQINSWIKQGWVQGDFTEDEEKRILKTYGAKLSGEHQARMDRLLYEGKLTFAKRMVARVPAAAAKRNEVRMAFIGKTKNAPKLLDKLSASEQRDPGILFERMRYRVSQGKEHELPALFANAPKEVPFPDLWWPMRAIAVREAINERRFTQALALLADHGGLKSDSLAEALWLKGWIMLQHKQDASIAYKQFFALYTSVYTPVSKARAAYWAGRAAEKNGNKDIANEWMHKAARYPTVFYGQMAHEWLHPNKALELPPMPKPSDSERKTFETDDLVLVTRALAKGGDTKMRDLFVTTLATRATTASQFALLAELANELGGTAAGVEVAKLALRNNVVLMDAGWPRIDLPKNLPLEPALTLAITRQESEFDPLARSPANARGLMQLLPSTAKHIAKRIDLPYKDSMLEDPASNMTMGSNYLSQIIDGFDGSYILGIASYNAGPGSVRRWIATMGKPPKTPHDTIDWIETIPFGETRNYVMRVLENVQVYRALANPEVPLKLEADLKRGH